MSAVTPSDLCLPVKFSSFRPGQLDACYSILGSSKRFLLLNAPTGFGKSLTYISLIRLEQSTNPDFRALVLVSTKALAAQLMSDFQECGMVEIKGQNNYPCVGVEQLAHLNRYASKEPLTCDEGPCHAGVTCPLKTDGGCEYYDAIDTAHDSPLVVSNYHYWLTLGKYVDTRGLGDFDLVIFDEAQNAKDILTAFFSMILNSSDVRQLRARFPDTSDIDVWVSWAKTLLPLSKSLLASYKSKIKSKTGGGVSTLNHLSTVHDNLRRLSSCESKEWIIDRSGFQSVTFLPLSTARFAERYLFRRIPKVVMVSSVISERDCFHLGLSSNDYTYLEAGRGFPPERRPFIHVPTIRNDNKATEGEKRQLATRMDNFIGPRLDRKGIIPTRSYSRATEVKDRSKFSQYMLTHTPRETRSTIERFIKSNPPCILVSPVVEEGYDFHDDLCRWIILPKIPFLYSRDPLVAARKNINRSYVVEEAAKAVMQVYGRSVRNNRDWCETVILDDHWFWMKKKKTLFAEWFRRAWKTSKGLPSPIDPSKFKSKERVLTGAN